MKDHRASNAHRRDLLNAIAVLWVALPGASTDGIASDGEQVAPVTQVEATACLEAPVAWGPRGSPLCPETTDRLLPCRTFEHSSPAGCRGPEARRCTSEISTDPVEPFSLQEVRATLSHPDLVGALAGSPTLLGFDSRLVDGTLFRLEVQGREILVGGSCRRQQASCRPIPAGVLAAARLLQDLSAHYLASPHCEGAGAD